MASIRFKHGSAFALLLLGLFSVLTGAGELLGGATGIRYQGGLIAVVLGGAMLVGGAWYLARTLDEAELSEKAKRDLGLETDVPDAEE